MTLRVTSSNDPRDWEQWERKRNTTLDRRDPDLNMPYIVTIVPYSTKYNQNWELTPTDQYGRVAHNAKSVKDCKTWIKTLFYEFFTNLYPEERQRTNPPPILKAYILKKGQKKSSLCCRILYTYNGASWHRLPKEGQTINLRELMPLGLQKTTKEMQYGRTN